MKKLSIGILTVIFASMSLAQAGTTRSHPQNLFIKMKAGESLVKSDLIKKSKRFFGRLYLVRAQNADALAQELSNDPSIEYIQKDFYAGKKSMPKHEVLTGAGMFVKHLQDFNFDASFNDPQVGKLWAFTAPNGLDVLGAYDSLPRRSAKEVIVAVVDTGVDHNHEDLKAIMWSNPKEIAGDKIDNDENGYIDDIHGINTLVRDAAGRATLDTMGSHWHGTHVAGTIAAVQNNGIGIAGVANNVKIMAIRTVPDDADELDSDIVEAYMYAANHGAKVINCSFGKAVNEGGMVVRDTINEIAKKGVLVVASAGNDSMGPFSWHDNDVSPKFPAAFDSANMLTIASTTNTGALSSFSNIGKVTVDVASPGSNVFSTVIGNKYSMASGTSMAAPNASGVVAMVMGYYPELSVLEVKEVLMTSVTPVATFADKLVSGGRLNLKSALAKAATLR